MIRRLAILIISTQILVGCEQTFYSCQNFDNEKHRDAYAYLLTEKKISFNVASSSSLCIDKSMLESDGFYKFEHQVDTYYRGVAANLTSQEQVKKVALWIETESIHHDFTVKSTGTFLVVYSGSPQEADNNRNKLNLLLNYSY